MEGQHLAVVGVSCRGYPNYYNRRMPLRLAGQHLTLQMVSDECQAFGMYIVLFGREKALCALLHYRCCHKSVSHAWYQYCYLMKCTELSCWESIIQFSLLPPLGYTYSECVTVYGLCK